MVLPSPSLGDSPAHRTVDWETDGSGQPGAVVLIDQTLLPGEVRFLKITQTQDLVECIKRLAVRGAPALGVAGALGVALAFQEHCSPSHNPADGHSGQPEPLAAVPAEFAEAVKQLREARPTAVNLARMVDRVASRAPHGFDAVFSEALKIRDEEIAASEAIGRRGAQLVAELVGQPKIVAMTICNTGGLASVERGTALGVVQTLHELGQLELAIALETRPLLQGARLTTWELAQMGAPYELIVDSAGPAILAQGKVDVVLAGADRIASNGDTANKIGTFSLALGAQYAGVPFLSVAPESTVDISTRSGQDIEIEDRGAQEVRSIQGAQLSVSDAPARNPAFDVTPASLITAIVTERRVIRLDRGETPGG